MHVQVGGVSASVRHAAHGDAAAIAALVGAAGGRTSAGEIEALTRQGEVVVLDDATGGVAAAMHVAAHGHHGTFALLTVSPERQGQGLGKRMVAVAEAMCSAMGCQTIAARVAGGAESLPTWYRRQGYEPAPSVSPLYMDFHKTLPQA